MKLVNVGLLSGFSSRFMKVKKILVATCDSDRKVFAAVKLPSHWVSGGAVR